MSHHPYTNLPDSQYWSTAVASPVNAQELLTIDPILESLADNATVVSGGSCFAQYIGKELASRGYDYLRSTLSAERVESFGLGNIYTIAQLKQWLEFCLGNRVWSDESTFQDGNQCYDLLLPHRDAMSSGNALREHRVAIKDEMLEYLQNADLFIFTIGLTEAWRNLNGDIYPSCPGTLIGEFDASRHLFHNYTCEEIQADLSAVESMLTAINPDLALLYTVSPVPLTATASASHVLLASSYSKSAIRAAVGQYCEHSTSASYFPSYELINHHVAADWRLENNLRSISQSGVRYVMAHAFAENPASSSSQAPVQAPEAAPVHPPENVLSNNDQLTEAACEEQLLDSYSRLAESASKTSDIILVGDCHMGKLASGFEASGIDAVGGIVMHGSAFTDYKFELSEDTIFQPVDNEEASRIWSDLFGKLKAQKGQCQIITNIGFQMHRTVNIISNYLGVPVLTEQNVADYYDKYYFYQVYILRELTKYGQVWMVEDPNFNDFIQDKDNAQIVRAKNFHTYCYHMRKIAQDLGIGYLNPCHGALQKLMLDSRGLAEIIHEEGFLGTQLYYDYLATVVNKSIGNESSGNDSSGNDWQTCAKAA